MLFLILGAFLLNISPCMAQDDIYFVPKKKKAKTETADDNWAEKRTSQMDVDTYNRRNRTKLTESYEDDAEYDDIEASGTYTTRIVRFHAPGVTYISSPYYTDYIDIWVNPFYAYSPWSFHYGYHYDPWGWNCYYGWGDPWFHYGWYDPWFHHGWHHHFHHHHYPVYYPGFHPGGPSYAVNPRPKRPAAIRDRYRPSTAISSNRDNSIRPSQNMRPSQNRNNVSTQKRPQSNSSRPSTTQSRPARERNFGTPSNSRIERNATPSRPSRSVNTGGSNRSMGRRR